MGFGEKSDDSRAYKNRRAELYGTLRERLRLDSGDDPFALPPCSLLRQELSVLPLSIDSEGRLVLPPKDRSSDASVHQTTIRQLLKRSPDRADSLVLAVRALRQAFDPYGTDDYMCCSGFPGDREPLTDAEIAELPEPYRGIMEDIRRHEHEWDNFKDDDDWDLWR